MFQKIQGFSFSNIDRFESSSLVTRMTTDVSNVQMAYMMLVRTAFRGPLMVVFSFVAAFMMGGRMAIIFCFVIPILGDIMRMPGLPEVPMAEGMTIDAQGNISGLS